MMKVSNETKVGALAAVSITMLILGFNFLKGKNLFKKQSSMFISFVKTEGLNVADPVKINGLRVGAVEGLIEKDVDLSGIVVSFHVVREINIPKDSYAKIVASPLGTASIIITMGKSTDFLQNGDTLKGIENKTMIESISDKLEPVVENVNKTLASLDVTVKKIGDLFDENANKNFAAILRELASTTNRLNALLEPNNGSLSASLDNIEKFTGSLTKNNDSISALVNNLTKVSRDISNSQLDQTIGGLATATENLNAILNGIKEGKGSLGMLTSDKQLYQNLNRTANSLNILLQDLKLHPKRYVQISVFGKKDKTTPLETALPDTLKK
jgi:phospholipid/cholesterol/gamma-HCH transport system substrate-binding protein